jgi:large subunit ribosomal protein L28
MSRVCPITGKGPMYGNNRSHSLRATRRRWNVNLQKATIMVNGKKTRVRISTSALRTLRKNNKLVKPVIAQPVKKEEAPVEAAKPAETKPVEAPKAEVKAAEEVKAEEKPAEKKAAPKAKKAAAKKPADKPEEAK